MALAAFFDPPERRAVTPASLFLSGGVMPSGTQSGVPMSQDASLKVNAIFAAVNLISDSVAMLPRDTYTTVNGDRQPFRPRPPFVNQPDADGATWQTFIQQWLVSKLISHAACVRILRNGVGDPIAFSVLDPTRVEPRREDGGVVYYDVDHGAYRVDAEDMIYDAELMRPGQIKGTSRVDELRETFGLSQALQEFSARFFGNGSTTSGIIVAPGEVTEDQANKVQDAWEKGHRGLRKAHRPGFLSGGASWVKTGVDPEQAQMLGSREFAVEEVCRAFKIPVAMLQSTKPGSQAYASREQDALQFATFTLMPYLTAIESHLSRLMPPGAYLRINVDALLRASLTDRFAAYSQAMQGGFMTINQINRLEDWPSVEGGDEYRVPLANVNLGAANIVEDDKKVTMATRLINVGFAPEDVLAALGLAPMKHTGLPSVQLQNLALQAETPADTADVYPVRTVRRVERDANGFIVRIIEEPGEAA
jgi:HK97 family phage portal protein